LCYYFNKDWKIMGWALFVCGAIGFVYGVLTMSWLITIISGVAAGVGWAMTHPRR